MSGNPQEESWSNDKPKLAPFRRPPRIHAKKNPIPDDWEEDNVDDDHGEDGGGSMETAEEDKPAQSHSQGKGENIKAPIAGNLSAPSSSTAKKGALPASHYDLGPSLPSFEPAVRILKRSTNSSGTTAAPTSAPPQKSLVEREREYQQARERIFGSTREGEVFSNGDDSSKDLGVSSVVQRQPQGPPSGDAMGFRRHV